MSSTTEVYSLVVLEAGRSETKALAGSVPSEGSEGRIAPGLSVACRWLTPCISSHSFYPCLSLCPVSLFIRALVILVN